MRACLCCLAQTRKHSAEVPLRSHKLKTTQRTQRSSEIGQGPDSRGLLPSNTLKIDLKTQWCNNGLIHHLCISRTLVEELHYNYVGNHYSRWSLTQVVYAQTQHVQGDMYVYIGLYRPNAVSLIIILSLIGELGKLITHCCSYHSPHIKGHTQLWIDQ